MGAHCRTPFKLTGRFCSLLEDDVRHLARKPGDAQARGIDDLDPVDVGRRSPLQLIDRAARLVGDALAVDQNVFRRLAKSALLVRRADREARHLRQHVVGGLGRKPREIGRGVDPLLPADGSGLWRGRDRRIARGCRIGLRGSWNGYEDAYSDEKSPPNFGSPEHSTHSPLTHASARATFVACYICSVIASPNFAVSELPLSDLTKSLDFASFLSANRQCLPANEGLLRLQPCPRPSTRSLSLQT